VSLPDTEIRVVDVEKPPVIIDEGRAVSQTDTSGQDENWRAQQELNPPKKGEFPKESTATVTPAVPKSNTTDQLAELVEAWSGFDAEQRAAFLTLIRSLRSKSQKTSNPQSSSP